MFSNTLSIVVASSNPVKINAARDGFRQMYPDHELQVEGLAVPSGVADQPMSCEETFQGAFNRLEQIEAARPDVDFHVGIEGGLETIHDQLGAFAWILVKAGGHLGKARTGTFFLAPKVTELVLGGMEMGHADDEVFGHTNSKHHLGATGILTHGAIDRAGFYSHGVVLALIPFRNAGYYGIPGL